MWNIIKTVGTAALQPLLRQTTRRYDQVFSSLCHTLCRSQTPSTFLVPSPVFTTQVAGLQFKGIVRLRCKGCRLYKKDGRLRVYCMDFPKHNQASLKKKFYNSWHLTHATQGKLRPY